MSGRRRRAPARAGAVGLLTAALIGAAAASAGALASARHPAPTPTAAVSVAPGTLPATVSAARAEAELVGRPESVAFLEAMRRSGVPTSRNGIAEVRVGRAACAELESGTNEDELAVRIPKGLPTVSRTQAAVLVDLAREHLC